MTIKVYLFILKSEKKLYAYTNNKDYAKRFLLERNKKLFLKVTKKVDDGEFIEFSRLNRKKLLEEIPLFDGTSKDISIIATEDEETKLMMSCDEIYNSVKMIEKELLSFPFKRKWKEIIFEACKLSMRIEDDDEVAYEEFINTFTLFYYLFKDTFIDSDTANIIKEKGEVYL